MRISKYIYLLMAFLLINVTLVRDLKLNKIGLKFTTSISNDAPSILSNEKNITCFLGDEFTETGEEEEEGEEENDVEDDDLFYSDNSSSAFTIRIFKFSFNYISRLPDGSLGKTTPPPRIC